jgi:transcriptional regulator with XRE-family HTH domain|tara:strand:- start:529 stop:1263 length:735 start_codon:yes stop_codon:yes gene_type:complete
LVNSFLIKEARESQNLSQEQLAKKLRLKINLIKNIEDGKPLEGAHSYYEKSYIRSIYKILNLNVDETTHITKVDFTNNHNILFIIYFLIFFTFTSLSLSYYIVTKFSGNLDNLNSVKNYKEDDTIKSIKNIVKASNVTFINDDNFIKSLKFLDVSNNDFFFEIKIKEGSQAYYKLHFPNKDKEIYGELKIKDRITIKKNDKFYLNFSNIGAIEYIIFSDKKYYSMINSKFYLKKFDINKLYNLK